MFLLKLLTNIFRFILKKLWTVWFYILNFYVYKPIISTVIIISLVVPIFLPWGNMQVFSRYTDTEHDLVTVLVSEDVYNNVDLSFKVQRYAQDVQNSYTDTKVVLLPIAKEKTSEEIYRILENYYFEGRKEDTERLFLRGIIVVGDVKLPSLKSEVGDMLSIFPYTDFENPSFIWDIEEKKWIENPAVNATSAEIWHGVIPGTIDELQNFFDKNHEMHEKLYSGQENFSDIIRDEILFWNTREEKKSMQKILLSQYEKGQDLNSERKSLRYNSELLQVLSGDMIDDENFNTDIPAEVKAMYPKDEDGNQHIFLENIQDTKDIIAGKALDDIADRYVKDSIEKLLPSYAEVVKTYEKNIQKLVENTGRWNQESTDSVPEMISLIDEYVGNEIQKINKIYEKESTEYFSQLDSTMEVPSYYGETTYTSVYIAVLIRKEYEYGLLQYLLQDDDFTKHFDILKNLFRWVHIAELHDQKEGVRTLVINLEKELEGVTTFSDFTSRDTDKIKELWEKLYKEVVNIENAHDARKDNGFRFGYNYINGRRVIDIEDPQDCSLYRGVYQSDNLYDATKVFFDWKIEKETNTAHEDIEYLYTSDFSPEIQSKSVKFTSLHDVQIMKNAHKVGAKAMNSYLSGCSILTKPEAKEKCLSTQAKLPVFSWDGGERIYTKEEIDTREFRPNLFESELYKNVQNIETSALACQKISTLNYAYSILGWFPFINNETVIKTLNTFILHDNPSTAKDSEQSLLHVVKSIYSKALASNRVVYADVLNGLTVKKYIKQTVPNFFRYAYKKALESSLLTHYEISKIAEQNAKEMIIGNGAYNRKIPLKNTSGVFINSPIFKARRVVKFNESTDTIEQSNAFITEDDFGKIPAEYELEVLENMKNLIVSSKSCNNLDKFDKRVLRPAMGEYYVEFFKKYTKIPESVYREFIFGKYFDSMQISSGVIDFMSKKTWEYKVAEKLISCDDASQNIIDDVKNYIRTEKSTTTESLEKTVLDLDAYFLPDFLTKSNTSINTDLNKIIDFSKITENDNEKIYWQWDPLTTDITPDFARLDDLPAGFFIPSEIGNVYFETFEIIPNFNDVLYKNVKVSGASFLGLRQNIDEKSDMFFEIFGRRWVDGVDVPASIITKEVYTDAQRASRAQNQVESVIDEIDFYDRSIRFIGDIQQYVFYVQSDLSKNVPKPNIYPEEIFHINLKGADKEQYDKKLAEQDFLFYWNDMTAQDKHNAIQKLLLSKNQEIVPPLQDKNQSKPYAYAHVILEGESSPEWKGEDDISSQLLGLPQSNYGISSDENQNASTGQDANAESNTDENGTEQDEECGPMEGVPIEEWLDAVSCWLDKMKDLPDLGSKKKCNLSLEEFKKLQEKDDVDTKNPVENIEIIANINPLLPNAENTIFIRFKTKEDKLAYGHDIRFTVELENAEMRDVVNDFDATTDGFQLINRTGEEVIEIIPNTSAEKVKISVVLYDESLPPEESEESEDNEDVTAEQEFSVIPNNLDILQIIKIPSEEKTENGVKAYGLKVVSPIDFEEFNENIILAVAPHEEGVLDAGSVELGELFHVAVRTDTEVRVNASLRGANTAEIILKGDESLKTGIATIQLPKMPTTLDVNSVYYFTPRYLNAMGTIVPKPDDVDLYIDSGKSEEDFKAFEIRLVDDNTRVKIETHGITGTIDFSLAVGKGDAKVVGVFSPFIGEKISTETYESLNINALYATIAGFNRYDKDLNNHFATKILHSSDNLNIITTQIVGPQVKKPIARIFPDGNIKTYSSGYRANILNTSPIEIGIFDKKNLRYGGKFSLYTPFFEKGDITIQKGKGGNDATQKPSTDAETQSIWDSIFSFGVNKPLLEDKGIFFERLNYSPDFIVTAEDDGLRVELENVDVLSVDLRGNITLFDDAFRLEIDEENNLSGFALYIKKKNTGDVYGRIVIRGAVFRPQEESIWIEEKGVSNYIVTDENSPDVDLFPMYQTGFSKSKLESGFERKEKYVLEYASGNTVGEATESSADLFMINIGDPSLSIPPPFENGTGFDETVGKKIWEEEKGVIKKILPFDFDGDGILDMAEVSSDGFINVLLNKGNLDGTLKQWGKAVRIDPDYRMIAVLKIKENPEDRYDDLVYLDKDGVFHHIKNIDGNITLVDNPSYFPTDLLSTAEIADIDKDGFSDIIAVTELGDVKIWYGNEDYFSSDAIVVDSYAFTIPSEEELLKGVLVNFKNIETLTDLRGEVKKISFLSNIEEQENTTLTVSDDVNSVFSQYEGSTLSSIISSAGNAGFADGISEKSFVKAGLLQKSLKVTKKFVEQDSTTGSDGMIGKKYITQIRIQSLDANPITFTIADMYGELMSIDRSSAQCKYVDTEIDTKQCGETYAGEVFPTVSRGVIFENITLLPSEEIELSYISEIKEVPYFTLQLANINKDVDDILDFTVMSKDNDWRLQYESDATERGKYTVVTAEENDSNALEEMVSNDIDIKKLFELLDINSIEVDAEVLEKILSLVNKIHDLERKKDDAIEYMVKMGYEGAIKNVKSELSLVLTNLLKDILEKDDINSANIEGIVKQLLEWDKEDDNGNLLPLTTADIQTIIRGALMAESSFGILEESGVTTVVDDMGRDFDDDGVPKMWDDNFDKELHELERVVDDTIDFLASCNAGGCLNMPFNFAFFTPGEVNMAPIINQVFTAVGGDIGSLLSGDGVSIDGSSIKKLAIDGVGSYTIDQPFVMTIFNYGSGTFCVLYRCYAYSPVVSIPFEAGFANSTFRFYLSPTITGGLGFVICTGAGMSTTNPGGSCFIQAIEGDFGEVCNELAAKINKATQISLGSSSTVFQVEGSVGGQSSDTATYSLANIDTSIPTSRNVRNNSEGYFGRWLNRQFEEVGSMFTVPSLSILYPDLSNTFFDTDGNTESFSLTAGMVDQDQFSNASDAFSTNTSNVTFENQWTEQQDSESTYNQERDDGVIDTSKSGVNSAYDFVTPQGKNKKTLDYTARSIDDFYRMLESVPLINVQREVVQLKYPSLSRKELLSALDNVTIVIVNFTEELKAFKESGKNWPKERWSEHQNIVKKGERFLKDLIKLKNVLLFYKDEAGLLIQDFDSQISRYIYSVVCYIDAITDLTGGWFMKNKIRYEKWLEFFDTIRELLKMYKKLPDILNGYQASCEQCRATEYDSSSDMVSVMGSFFPEPPIIHFPRFPDLVLDVSQINAAITITIPEIRFSAVDIRIPSIPNVMLPNVPILSARVKFPQVPNLPVFELPTLPDFPEIDIPRLPDIPPPPKLPDIPSGLLSIMTVVEKALYLYCIVVRQGIFLHDETTAMSVVQVLTNRPVNPLSMDFISKDFPDIVISDISEIEVIAEVNLEKDTGEISESVHEFVDDINRGTTNFIKEGNRNLSENVDEYREPLDLSDNKYVKDFEEDVSDLQDNIDREADKHNNNVKNLNTEVEERMDNVEEHIDRQEERNQENVDEAERDIRSSKEYFDVLIAGDMQELHNVFSSVNNPDNYISVTQLREKMGLPLFEANISQKSHVLEKYGNMQAELSDIQKFYATAYQNVENIESTENIENKNIDFFALVEKKSHYVFPASKVYAFETTEAASAVNTSFDIRENTATRNDTDGVFIQSEDGTTTVRMTAYTEETPLINSFFTADMNGDGIDDIVYATPYEIYIKYAESSTLYKKLKYEKRDVYVPINGDVDAIEVLDFDEILPEFLSPKNLTIFGDGKKVTVSVLPEDKQLLSGIQYQIDDSITYEQRVNGKQRKYVFQLLKDPFDSILEKYSGLTEKDIDWDAEVGESFIEISGKKIEIQPNSIVRIDKFDYQGLEIFLAKNEVKSIQARWITADGELSNYASHDVLLNIDVADGQAPFVLDDIVEEKLMYKTSRISIGDIFDLETGDSFVSWDTDNDGVFETQGESFTTKIHEWLFEKEIVPFKVVDAFGNESIHTATVSFVPPAVVIDDASIGTVSGHVKPRYANVPVVLLRERFGVLKKIEGPQRTDSLGNYVFDSVDTQADNLVVLKDVSGTIIGVVDSDGQLAPLPSGENNGLYKTQLLVGDEYLPLRQVLVNTVTGKIVATLLLQSKNEYTTKFLDTVQSFSSAIVQDYTDAVFIADSNKNDAFIFGQMPLDAPDNAGGGVIFDQVKNEPMVMIYKNGNIRFFESYQNVLSVEKKDIVIKNSVTGENEKRMVIEIRNGGSVLFEVLLDINQQDVSIDFDTVASAKVLEYENNSKKYAFINTSKFLSAVDNLIPNSDNTSSEEEKVFPFIDISEEQNEQIYTAVQNLYEKNMISGYENNEFRPNQKITRAEFVHDALAVTKCLDCILPSEAEKEKYYKPFSFTDITPKAWYDFCISKAKEISMINGYKNGEFRPHQNITRAEAVAILLRQADIPLEETLTQSAVQSVGDVDPSQWFYKEMITAINLGLVVPTLGFSFPQQHITRGEFAIMADKIFVLRDCREVDSDNDGFFDYWEEYYGSDIFDENSIPNNTNTLKNPRDELLSPIPINGGNSVPDITDKKPNPNLNSSSVFDKKIREILEENIENIADIDMLKKFFETYTYEEITEFIENSTLESVLISLIEETMVTSKETVDVTTLMSTVLAIITEIAIETEVINTEEVTITSQEIVTAVVQVMTEVVTPTPTSSTPTSSTPTSSTPSPTSSTSSVISPSPIEQINNLCPLVPEDYDGIDDEDGCPELENAEFTPDVQNDFSTLFVNNTEECNFVDYADVFRKGDSVSVVILSPDEQYLYKESNMVKVEK